MVLSLSSGLAAQTTEKPSNQPKTAPQSQAILSSYEGQNVTAVEIAGRPNLDTSKLLPLLTQHSGEPFSKEKIDESIAALKKAGNFEEVQLQIEPEAKGVRLLLVAEPPQSGLASLSLATQPPKRFNYYPRWWEREFSSTTPS